MTYEFVLWICVAAYALHMVEERVLNWKKWSETKMGHSHFEWADFYVSHAIKLVIGFCCAMIGWQAPAFSLLFPALMLYSAVFSHLIPALKFKKVCPGLITTFLLLFPIGIWAYWGANQDVALNPLVLVLSLVFGAFVKWSPGIFVRLNKKIS